MLAVTKTSWPSRWNGAAQRARDALGHPDARRRRRATSFEQDGELVAAEPGDGVARAQRRDERPAICDQQLVAGQVAEAVVDDLEAVEVEEEDGGQPLRLAARALDRLPQPVHEQRAVGQAGERVVEGVVEELLLGLLAVGDVVGVEHDAGDRRLSRAGSRRSTRAPARCRRDGGGAARRW